MPRERTRGISFIELFLLPADPSSSPALTD